MKPVFVDYETFWDVGYTLSKMTPLEYVCDERFELQTCSTIVGARGEPVFTVGFDETAGFLRSLDLSDAILVAHNGNEFDHMISHWKLGLRPRMWGDTIAMARPHHAKVPGLSLKKLAEHYGLREKGSLDFVNTKGKRLEEFTAADLMRMRAYNDDDAIILRDLFPHLMRKTSADDMRMIDETARMTLEPQFRADVDLLERGLKAERVRKKRQLHRLATLLGIHGESLDWEENIRATCSSAPKFKKLLSELGVECPMKVSPRTGKEIPALAKTDADMQTLLEHPDEVVQAAAEARLGVKSTQLETRIGRFLDAARMCDGWLPVPLRFAGADTTLRFSGTFALNMQNLPRIGKQRKISDVLRYSLKAPEGYVVVVADLSAIELRVNHFLWQEPDTMARFHADPEADVYRAFAAEELYHIAENLITKLQRFVAKVAQLQLGYYSGAPKLQDAARIMSDGDVLLEFPEAKRIVDAWRAKYNHIVAGWHRLGEALQVMHDGSGLFPIDEWGLCLASKHGIKTPKALLTYPQLHQREVERFGRMQPQWFYKSSRGVKAVHGGVLCENLCQHLAGQVMKDAIVAFSKTKAREYCYRPHLAHQVHDEAIYVAKARHGEFVLETLQEKLRARPTWWPELVTWSEGGIADCYGKVDK